MNADDKDAKTILRTLQRGLLLLETLATADEPVNAKTLSRQLGIPIGTCYHLLRTLLDAGHVVRLPGACYDVGPRAASLNRHLQLRSGSPPELAALLMRLRARTRTAAYMTGWHHGSLIIQHYLRASEPDDTPAFEFSFTGTLHARAAGKSVLAHLPEERVSALLGDDDLTAFTPATITDHQALAADFNQVRRRGYAVSIDEFRPHRSCISAPYFGKNGEPAGAFALSLETERMPQLQHFLAAELRAAADTATHLAQSGRLTLVDAYP
ncbi:IclR family transcriptional regulator [Streptomyces chartreusis]